jgi:hypothetical protein
MVGGRERKLSIIMHKGAGRTPIGSDTSATRQRKCALCANSRTCAPRDAPGTGSLLLRVMSHGPFAEHLDFGGFREIQSRLLVDLDPLQAASG